MDNYVALGSSILVRIIKDENLEVTSEHGIVITAAALRDTKTWLEGTVHSVGQDSKLKSALKSGDIVRFDRFSAERNELYSNDQYKIVRISESDLLCLVEKE